MNTLVGGWVLVRAYGDEVLRRRAVGLDERMVYISTDAEFQCAKVEGREPVCVGFFREAIVAED